MKKLLFTVALLLFSARIFALSIYAPTLVAPLDNAVNQMPNALMDWSPVAAAVSYQIQIDTSSSFTNPTLLTATSSALNATDLMFGIKYYWRVRAIGSSADTSAWSTSRKFTVLSSFVLLSPLDSVYHCYPNQLLKWQASPALTGFSYFDIELDTTLNYNSSFLKTIIATGTLNQKNASELHFGMKYFWRMRGHHSLDSTNWSASRCLFVMDTLKTTAPADSALNSYPNVQMVFVSSSATTAQSLGLTKFEYQTDTSLTFSSAASFDGYSLTNKVNADTLLFGMHYYWRVRGLHNTDTSGWSMVKNYFIVNSPILVSPANGSNTWPSLAPLLKWTKIGGVLSYEIQIDTSLSFSHPIIYNPGPSAISQQTSALIQGKTSYWRMRAISSRDTSPWCTPWSFYIPGVGVESLTLNASNISVFPNPTNGNTFIKFESSDASQINVSVINILGKTIRQEVYNVGPGNTTKEMNLDGVASGIYFMKFTKANSSFVQKLTIQ
jgi:hypothetical protein